MADGASSNGGDTKTSSEKVSNGQQQQSQPSQAKQVVATKVTGVVKWFNVKSGYGFINRSDTKEDVFVHQSAIVKNNPRKLVRSVGDGEEVEFDVVIGDKGNEAANVTGIGGEAVKGSPYAADRRRGNSNYYKRRSGGDGAKPSGDAGAAKEDGELEGQQGEVGGEEGQPRRGGRRYRGRSRFVPRYRGGRGGRRAPRGEGQGDAGKTTEEEEGSGAGTGGAVKESGDGEATSRPRGGSRGRGRGRRGFTRRFYRRGGPRGGGGGGSGNRQQSNSAGEQSEGTQGEETEEPAKN